MEEFFVRRRMGGFDLEKLSMRQVEAFLILERAVAAEVNDEQHNA